MSTELLYAFGGFVVGMSVMIWVVNGLVVLWRFRRDQARRRADRLERALRDALSVLNPDAQMTILRAERIEAWKEALK